MAILLPSIWQWWKLSFAPLSRSSSLIICMFIGCIFPSYCQGECPATESQTDLGWLSGVSSEQKTTGSVLIPCRRLSSPEHGASAGSAALHNPIKDSDSATYSSIKVLWVNLWYGGGSTVSELRGARLIKPTSEINVFARSMAAEFHRIISTATTALIAVETAASSWFSPSHPSVPELFPLFPA